MKKTWFILSVLLLLFLSHEIKASPLVMVEAIGIVDGYVGESIGSKIVELRINDADYRFEAEEDEEITDWFGNIPTGLEAYVSAVNDTQLFVSFEGVPSEISDVYIQVTVPDGSIIDLNSGDPIGDLENTPSDQAVYQIGIREPLAVYDRESTVSGHVGEELGRQQVYIRLKDTTCEASMMHHGFPVHNGLIPKVIEILPENIIVVEYSGVPLEEDHSLIHTLLLNEDLKCDQDLEVADREDVRFDINVRSKEVPDDEEVGVEVPVYVMPYTGVE